MRLYSFIPRVTPPRGPPRASLSLSLRPRGRCSPKCGGWLPARASCLESGAPQSWPPSRKGRPARGPRASAVCTRVGVAWTPGATLGQLAKLAAARHLEAAVLGEPHVHPAAPVNEGLQHLGTRLVVELEPHALGARRVVLAPLHHLVGEGPKRVLRRRAAASCMGGAEMRRA